MLSIVIPTRQERLLEKTIQDLLDNCTGDFEILVVLDGYNPSERNTDSRVIYIYHEKPVGMREAINSAVKVSKGEFIMKMDAHCLVDKGFDEKMTAVCEDNYVVTPRRYRLDDKNWCRIPETEKMYVDYEKMQYPWNYNPPEIHGFRDDERLVKNADIMVDDIMLFQGSCWLMKKIWFEKNGFMRVDGYGSVPQQESSEICFTTWLRGGRVVVNKNTWYAHYRKTSEYGRGYFQLNKDVRKVNQFASEFWLTDKLENRAHDFKWLLDKFMPERTERIMKKIRGQIEWTDKKP